MARAMNFKPKTFEKSPADADKGVKEGSKKDMALDKKQAKGNPFKSMKKGMK